MLERTGINGAFRMLLTGDLEKEGEEVLLRQKLDLKCDVLKAGHHGSSGASSEAFLEEAGGKWAVLSCGREN